MNKNITKETKSNKSLTSDEHILANRDDSLIIVAIGASAGGLESLKSFFLHSIPNPDIAFVIITHLSPDHTSALNDGAFCSSKKWCLNHCSDSKFCPL